MSMQADGNTISTTDSVAHRFDLVGIYIRRRDFDRGRQIDYGFIYRRRLPDIDYRVANLDRVIEFGAGETLG